MLFESRILAALICAPLALLAGCTERAEGLAAPEPWVLVQPAVAAVDPGRGALGIVRAAQLHVIASETGGRVEQVTVEVGDRVRRGQLLVALGSDVASHREQAARQDLARAEAQLAERRRNRERVAGLVSIGAASDAEAEQSRVEQDVAATAVAVARTELASARRDLSAVRLTAPVAGVVAARHVERSAVAAPGAALLEIDGDGVREIVAVAADELARLVRPGTGATWRAGGATGRAVVERIGPRAGGTDARELVLRVSDGDARPGAIVELAFPDAGASASARVPAAALLTRRDGSRTVRVVDAERRVREVQVELVRLVAGGALVAGELAPGTLIVSAGAQYVAPGTRVQPRVAAR